MLFQLFPKQLLELFAASEDMIALGVPALRIISIAIPAAAVTIVTGYITSGLGDGVTNMIGSFLRQFVPLIPLAWVIAKLWGIDYVWYAIWVSELCVVVFAVVRVVMQVRRKLVDMAE